MKLDLSFDFCAYGFLLISMLSIMIKNKKDIAFSLRAAMPVIFLNVVQLLELIAASSVSWDVPVWVKYLLCCALMTVQAFVPCYLLHFVYGIMEPRVERNRLVILLEAAPFIINAVLIIASPLSHGIFYFDDVGYHRGDMMPVSYLSLLLYTVLTAFILTEHRDKLSLSRRVVVSLVMVCLCAAAAVSVIFTHTPLYNMCITMAALSIYAGTERMTDRVDQVTGALKRDIMLSDIQSLSAKGVYPRIYAAALDNFNAVNEIYGVEGGDAVLHGFASSLKSSLGSGNVYRFDGDIFCVIADDNIEGKRVLETIKRVLTERMSIKDSKLKLSACVCSVETANYNSAEIISAVEYAVKAAKDQGKGVFYELHEDSAAILRWHKAIEQAIQKNIDSGTFEVHYQPIYDTKSKRFHSMEALAKLNVPEYGYVSPEEFIRVAEKNGTILQIGMLVFEEVCRFIKDFDLKNKGIEFVEVNLSVVQCMQETIYDYIKDTLKKYDVPPEMINLEITESAAAYSEKRLIQNMARLSLMCITFSLDDYGSGYSNINYLVDLPFAIVKIDKYVVWAATKNMNSRIMLENIIAMFKAMNLKVVAEGIEDKEMADMVIKMGVDYIQGYYYGKPSPKNKLVSCLEDAYIGRFAL